MSKGLGTFVEDRSYYAEKGLTMSSKKKKKAKFDAVEVRRRAKRIIHETREMFASGRKKWIKGMLAKGTTVVDGRKARVKLDDDLCSQDADSYCLLGGMARTANIRDGYRAYKMDQSATYMKWGRPPSVLEPQTLEEAALREAAREVTKVTGSIPAFNDSLHTTKEQVLEALEQAERSLDDVVLPDS